ncbi:A-kinase anchor protein 13-like, partial [Spea bombifrons]|uniref:A-kinase anchor protein 13-like n=1 Tax=Spea bombifrons TaxID=233779 RepID=UPI00234B4231
MKLNPQQAPLYGDSVLTVQLTEDKELEGGDAVFYLLFTGSTLNHLTSTRKVNAATLETVTPGHDCCERVKVSLCASRKGFSVVVAEDNFDFVQDEAYDSAQFLAANADNQQALIFARFLDRSRPSPGDVTVLDEKITLAFRHLHLPSDWNVLGGNPRIKDVQLQETLMHFAARLGLCRLSKFLLEQPGGRRALAVPNNEGATPLSLALERGFLKLHHLLTVEEAGQQDFECEASHVERVGDSCVKHHCGLNVYALSKKSQDETNMENRIEELNSYIHSHSNCPGNRVRAEQETALEQTTDLCHFHDGLQNCPVDKTLSPGKTVLSDAKNTDSPDLPLADAEKSKKEESFVELDNTMETVGEEVAVFSFESKNKDIEAKEEEVGSAPIVESENVSATSDYIQSLSSDLHTVESLLSGQNRNEETGMTSPGIVLDQEGLCERDSTSQEMITTEETASVNASAKEARNQASDLTNNSSANMGQAVSGYCTSAEEAQSYTESSDQETSETEPLLNLPTCSLNNSVDITDVSSDQEMSVHALQQCHTLDPEQRDPTTENGLVGLDTPNGIEGNNEKPLDNCLDILNKSIILINEPELPDVIM